MKQYICYHLKIIAVVFYNSISVENRYFVKACSNDAIIIKQFTKNINLQVWLNVMQPDFLELLC